MPDDCSTTLRPVNGSCGTWALTAALGTSVAEHVRTVGDASRFDFERFGLHRTVARLGERLLHLRPEFTVLGAGLAPYVGYDVDVSCCRRR